MPAAIGFAGVLFGALLSSYISWRLSISDLRSKRSLQRPEFISRLIQSLLSLQGEYSEYMSMVDEVIAFYDSLSPTDLELLNSLIHENVDESHKESINKIIAKSRDFDGVWLQYKLTARRRVQLIYRLTAIIAATGNDELADRVNEVSMLPNTKTQKYGAVSNWFPDVIVFCLQVLGEEFYDNP